VPHELAPKIAQAAARCAAGPSSFALGNMPKSASFGAAADWSDALLHFWNKKRKVNASRRDKSVPRDLQQLGGLIKTERERAGLTVRQLADAAGLVPSTVSRLETGQIATPRPDHLQRLARALGIDVEELYAEAGYLTPGSMPELRTYLRAKYGLTDQQAGQMEGYLQALRDTNQSGKEGQHDTGGETP
jgi:transcriptional regulator with XRE-family HTH domain